MQIRSKPVDLDPLLSAIDSEPLTRAEICERSGLTYQQLRKQLPQLIQRGDITWSSQRNDRGHEIRRYNGGGFPGGPGQYDEGVAEKSGLMLF
jgi:hypothetical protein